MCCAGIQAAALSAALQPCLEHSGTNNSQQHRFGIEDVEITSSWERILFQQSKLLDLFAFTSLKMHVLTVEGVGDMTT